MTDNIFFSSDTHFHHQGILRFGRGEFFPDVEAMNELLISNWNERVSKSDRVYHLGDFSFGNKTKIVSVFERLNGNIHMIRGNHDVQLDALADRFVTYGDYKEIKVGDQKICMSHFPFLTWNQAHHGSYMLHGHSHGLLAPTTQPRMDIGVDPNNFYPVAFEEVQLYMADKVYEPVDHHTSNKDDY